jgi:tripartite-type tricarboxylate transporter receptor subunit TctC
MRWLLLALLMLPAQAIHAQPASAFPSKAIRIVIPLPPGGVTDAMARLIGQKLQQAWGQTVVPENRPGASHFVAAELVAKSPPDGHTVFLANHATLAMNPGLFVRMPYDPLRDFVAVSLLVTAPNVLVAHPSVPARDLAELLALARQRPGALNYGSQGNGSSGHVGMAMLELMAGVKMTHVPYKGPAAASQDLLAGQIHLLFDTVFSQLGNLRGGKLRALAVSSRERHPLLADVPAVSEQGLPGFEVLTWFGMVAPARTPPEIVARLNAEVVKSMRDPEISRRLTEQGLSVVGSSAAEFQQHIEAEHAKWTRAIREMKISAD